MGDKQGSVDWDGVPITANGEMDYWACWRLVDPVSIREATRLLASLNPKPSHNRIDADRDAAAKADAWETALLRSVQAGSVHAAKPLAWFDGGYNGGYNGGGLVDCEPQDPDLCNGTLIAVVDLVRWADECGIPHRWPRTGRKDAPRASDLSHYPEELRAAVEAFEAVHTDPKATAGKSAKQAVAEWLNANKPDLSANARDRIATVANWQQAGGAPKTPS